MTLNNPEYQRPFNKNTPEENLGIKNPLLTPAPLGQTPLGSKFYQPQAAQSLAVLFSVSEQPTEHSSQDSHQPPPEILTPQPKIQEITDNELEESQLPLLPTIVENLAHIAPKPALLNLTSQKLPLTLEKFAEPANNFSELVLEFPTGNTSLAAEESAPFFQLNSQGIFYNNPEENNQPEFMTAGEGEEIIFTPSGFQRQEKKQIPPQTAAQNPSPPVTIQAKKTSPNQNNENLEILAEKVYKILKYRLQIEAERSGRYRYGKLP